MIKLINEIQSIANHLDNLDATDTNPREINLELSADANMLNTIADELEGRLDAYQDKQEDYGKDQI